MWSRDEKSSPDFQAGRLSAVSVLTIRSALSFVRSAFHTPLVILVVFQLTYHCEHMFKREEGYPVGWICFLDHQFSPLSVLFCSNDFSLFRFDPLQKLIGGFDVGVLFAPIFCQFTAERFGEDGGPAFSKVSFASSINSLASLLFPNRDSIRSTIHFCSGREGLRWKF